MSYSADNHNPSELYSMNHHNTPHDSNILEYNMAANNTSHNNAALEDYNINYHDNNNPSNTAIVPISEPYEDDYQNSNAVNVVKPQAWYRRKTSMAAMAVIGIIIVIVALVIPKNKSSSSSTSKALTHKGPVPPTPEVDSTILQKNQDAMLGDFLMANYVKLSVPNWSSKLQDLSTPQGKAFQWVSGRSSFITMTPLSRVQRFALAVFYYSTFLQDHPFMNTKPTDWNSADAWISDVSECQWEGIICDGNSAVTSILLSSHALTGSIPHELAMLDQLKELDLISNYVYMEDDMLDVFLHMPNLKELRLEDNFIVSTTGLPTQFAALQSIEIIQMSYNLLQGRMNGTIFKTLDNLQQLEVESNYLSGALPSQLGQLPNLVYLYARRNMLDFTLADFIPKGSFPAIFSLWLDNNEVRGTIPTEIGYLTGLASISITNASLIGTIPTEFAKLTDMKRVWLYDNELSGPIPTALISLQQLEVFEVHDNKLNGTMPAAVCQYISSSDYTFRTLTADCDEVKCDCCTICY